MYVFDISPNQTDSISQILNNEYNTQTIVATEIESVGMKLLKTKEQNLQLVLLQNEF